MTQRKTISQIIQEAYMDPDLVGGAQVRKSGEGGRKYPERRKSPEERKRVKFVGGGKTEPVVQKDRKDIGQERSSKRETQPERERGSAALSAKEAQRKAYLERKARESKGSSAPSTAKDKEKEASKLLTTAKPKPKVDPNYKPAKPSGYSRKERVAMVRKGERKLENIMRGQEKEKASKRGEKPSKGEITKRVKERMRK